MNSYKYFIVLVVISNIFFHPTYLFGNSETILDSQHPYYDALILFNVIQDNNVDKNEITKVMAILKKYLNKEDRDNLMSNVSKNPDLLKQVGVMERKFRCNAYISDYLNIIKSTLIKSSGNRQMSSITIYNLNLVKSEKMNLAKVDNFSVGTLAKSMTEFLVERTKNELIIAFFEKFRKILEMEKFGVLKTLFPASHSTLLLIDKEISNFPSYLNEIRKAFNDDLSVLNMNLPKIMELDEFKLFLDKNEWIKKLLNSALEIIKELNYRGLNIDILDNIDTKIMSSDELINLKHSIILIRTISNSLKKNNDNSASLKHYWISLESFKKLKKKHEYTKQYEKKSLYSFEIYLGLIYQETIGNDFNFRIRGCDYNFARFVLRPIRDNGDKIKELMTKIENFLIIINKLEISQTRLKICENTNNVSIEDYYNVYNSIMDTFEYSIEFFKYSIKVKNPPGEFERLETQKLKSYLGLFRKFGYIYLNLKQKKYSSAILNIVRIANIIVEISDKTSSKTNLFRIIKTYFLKYGAFMAAVVKAENSDEIKKAIEAAALPVGSYRIKRTRRLTISLNSYLGLFCNQEKFLQQNSTDTTSLDKMKIKNLSITAPIGLAFNWGINTKKNQKRPGLCLSIFASIIDLGAIVRFHFKNDEDIEGLSELEWKDIFAPGAFLLFNLNKLPISFGGGVQLAPMLKEVNEDGILEIAKTKRIRWGLMVVVDIPLIHFK